MKKFTGWPTNKTDTINSKRVIGAMGVFSSAVEKVSPCLAASFAEKLFLSPIPFRIKNGQKDILKSASKLCLYDGKHQLKGWRWGSGPAILLSHGWGGIAAQYSELIPRLVDLGFSVVAFDHPGHGESSGKYPTLYNFYDALKCVHQVYGPFAAVVGHSIGALALGMLAADGVINAKLVLISPLSDAEDVMETFSGLTGFSLSTLELMKGNIEKRYGRSFSEGDLSRLEDSFSYPIHVIHDQGDRYTSWQRTNEWVENNSLANLVSTKDLGHSRILEDREVIESICRFIGLPRGNIRTQMLSEYAL